MYWTTERPLINSHNQMSEPPLSAPVTNHPPRTQVVYLILWWSDDKLSTSEIAEWTHLPERTVQRALKDLRECGAVERHHTPTPVKWLYTTSDD